MKMRLTLSLLVLIEIQCYSQAKMNIVTKNGMAVSWEFKESRVYFEMSAPTDGWAAIGFNDSENTAGNYLVMGNMINNKVTIEEHYTISAGNYKSFHKLNTNASIGNMEGSEIGRTTKLKFSLPQSSTNKYAKDLKKGLEYVLLIAYSQEDDFQHHSIMRTSQKIIL
jgi:DOMON domain